MSCIHEGSEAIAWWCWERRQAGIALVRDLRRVYLWEGFIGSWSPIVDSPVLGGPQVFSHFLQGSIVLCVWSRGHPRKEGNSIADVKAPNDEGIEAFPEELSVGELEGFL
jgi:hypothetical protein